MSGTTFTDDSGAGTQYVTAGPIYPTLTSFTAGDLVISISGDGDGSGAYGDNQASPITLEELTTTGTIVGQLVLPQTTTIVNGTTEWAISGEYGSSSEGSLQLSADGQSLVIAGYGVSAATFNAGGAAVYGTAALAQSTSVPGTGYTPVARVIADIGFNGSIDTSTALYNVFNTNNPRSVATTNGSTFYISGQGVKGDTTQGVFAAHDGANSATAIDTSTDTRTAEIVNGELYVSRDSSVGPDNIANYGSTLPTSATAGVPLAGIDGTITLTAAQANGVNSADIGQTVHLSPENFFFASPDVLYVADGGNPKQGGLGDGGLQKWVYDGTTWNLEYTLSAGLNLVANTATAGTTGLIGLTGTVIGGVAYLYATNETVGDLDQTYLYGITDTVASTTGDGESFTALVTAAADSNIRGISFAPTQAVTTPATTSVTSGTTQSGVVVTSGGTLDILNGGTAVAATILSGGTAVVSAGGTDIGDSIGHGANETVLGSATGDYVGGTQLVSAATAVVSNETILNGGSVELFLKGAIGNALTVETGGVLAISGNATAAAAVLAGGTLLMESPKAVLAGSLDFIGAGTIEVSALSSAGYGDLAVISGFGAGDIIDFTTIGATGTLATTTVGGNTVATVTGGGITQSYTFAGVYGATLQLVGDGGAGEEITFSAPPPVITTIGTGSSQTGDLITSGSTLDVQSGGTAVAATIMSGGSAVVEAGGVDSGSVISAGGNELLLGSANADAIYGTQLISAAGALATNETVYAGGAVDLFLKGGVVDNLTVESGGAFNINGNATGSNTVLNGGVIDFQSPKANLTGSLTFESGGTLEYTDISSAGYGDLAVISGFAAGDAVDFTLLGSGATLSTTLSGGETVATVTSGGVTQSAFFAGDLTADLTLVSDGAGGEEIVYGSVGSSSTSSSTATSVTSGMSETGLVVSGGSAVDVLSGGTIVGATIQSGGSVTVMTGGFDSGSTIAAGGTETVGGSANLDQVSGTQYVGGAASGETILAGGLVTVQAGGVDSGSTISAGGNETVLGSASGDTVGGTQLVSAGTAVVSNETIVNGGSVELFLAGVIGNNLTVDAGGVLAINGRGTAESTVMNGGTLLLESAKSTLSGTLTFESPSTLEETATVSVTSGGLYFGDMALIQGFGAGDVIDLTANTAVGAAGAGATMNITTSGGTTYATVSGDGSTETFIFAGTTVGGELVLQSDGAGGEEIVFSPTLYPNTIQLSGTEILSLGAQNVTAQNGLVQTGGTLSGNGTLTVFGGGTLTAGVETGPGLTRLIGTNVLGGGIALDGGRTVENDGWIYWSSGNIVLGAGDSGAAQQSGTISNTANHVFYITADARMTNQGAGTSRLDNAGITAVFAGSGETDIDAFVANTGDIQVQTGTLSLNGGGSSVADHLYEASGAVLQFGTQGSGAAGGTFTITGGRYAIGDTAITGGTLDVSAASEAIFAHALTITAGKLQLGAVSDAQVQQAPLVQSGGTLTGSTVLTAFDGATLTGGVQSGPGVTRLEGNSTIGGSFALDGGRTLENGGWLAWSSGNIALGSGDSAAVTHTGTLTNDAGAVLYVTADGRIGVGQSGVVNNAGVMAVFAGSGETDIDAALDSTGGLQVQTGTLSLNGGGTIDAGKLYVASGAVLQFGTQAGTGLGGSAVFQNGPYIASDTVLQAGTVDLSGVSGVSFGNALAVNGGLLLLGGNFAATADFSQSGGALSGSGWLQVQGPALLAGGAQTGTGRTVLQDGGTLSGNVLLDGGRSLQNDGTLDLTGSLQLGAGTPGLATPVNSLINAGGAVLDIQGDGTIVSQGSIGSGVIQNAGTLLVSAGSGTATIAPGMFNNGVVEAASGTLQLQGGVSGSGSLVVDGPATLDFGNLVAGNESLSFLYSGGAVETDTTGSFGATIAGFAAGDTLDARAVLSSLSPEYTFNAGSLVVSDGTHSVGFMLTGSYDAGSFVLSSDGHGGTAIGYT